MKIFKKYSILFFIFISLNFLIFSLIFINSNDGNSDNKDIIPYPTNKNIEKSKIFKVYIDNNEINVENIYKNIHLARFFFSNNRKNKNIKIKIKYTKDKIRNFTLSPIKINIKTKIKNNYIEFEINKPVKLLIHNLNNNKETLCIFCYEYNLENNTNKTINYVNLKNYNIDPNGKGDLEKNTINFQKAINDSSSKNKILYIPKGFYRVKKLYLYDNTSIYMEPGAYINLSSYGFMIYTNANNIVLKGYGNIIGEDNLLHLFGCEKCSNIEIKDITFINKSAGTGVFFINSRNINIENVNIISKPDYYADGLDLDSVINFKGKDLFIYSGDDCIAFHAGYEYEETENVTFENGIYYNNFSGGIYKFANINIMPYIKNVHFYNETGINSATHSIAFYVVQGTLVENIFFNNIILENGYKICDFFTEIKDHWTTTQNNVAGEIKNIFFNNLFVYFTGKENIFSSIDSNKPITNIYFNNFLINGKLILDPSKANFIFIKNVSNIFFSPTESKK